MEVNGFVTAGGSSSRMGRDKAWLELGGSTMIERIIVELKKVTPTVAVIASSREYARLGVPVYADTNIGVGPLEAIRTALANAHAERVILVGCDLPFVTAALFSSFLDRAEGYGAVIPLGPDGKLEPLCGVYATNTIDYVTDLIRTGQRKVSCLFDLVPTRIVGFDEIKHLPGSDRFFYNVNTPGDYARAVEVLG